MSSIAPELTTRSPRYGAPMAPRELDETILATLLALDSTGGWDFDGGISLGFDAGHPQGMVLVDDTWWISSVDIPAQCGWLMAVDGAGRLLERWPCGDTVRYHPGGTDCADGGLWLAAAEYRPDSTTDVYHCALGATPEKRFRYPDHLGAIAPAGDGSLVAWTWGSRDLLRLDTSGTVLDRRVNPSHYVDYQDLQVLSTGHAVCSGIGRSLSRGGRRLGGLGVLRLEDLTWAIELPFRSYSPVTDLVATANPLYLDVVAGRVRVHLLPDERDGTILTWSIPAAS